jgi:hypothetical protein
VINQDFPVDYSNDDSKTDGSMGSELDESEEDDAYKVGGDD